MIIIMTTTKHNATSTSNTQKHVSEEKQNSGHANQEQMNLYKMKKGFSKPAGFEKWI